MEFVRTGAPLLFLAFLLVAPRHAAAQGPETTPTIFGGIAFPETGMARAVAILSVEPGGVHVVAIVGVDGMGLRALTAVALDCHETFATASPPATVFFASGLPLGAPSRRILLKAIDNAPPPPGPETTPTFTDELGVAEAGTVTPSEGNCGAADVPTAKITGNYFTVGNPPPAPLPDLLPVPIESSDFCTRTTDGQSLVVRVKNQGDGAASASTTRVVFSFTGGPVTRDVATPALSPSATVDVQAAIPPGCFDPDCGFTIAVDAGGAVSESDETNNGASGQCLG